MYAPSCSLGAHANLSFLRKNEFLLEERIAPSFRRSSKTKFELDILFCTISPITSIQLLLKGSTMKLFSRLCVLLSMLTFATAHADSSVTQIRLQSGERLLQQLFDGRLVQVSCAGATQQAPRPTHKPTQCTVTINASIFRDYIITANSPVSKLDAMTQVQLRCISQLSDWNPPMDVHAFCGSLSLGYGENQIQCVDI